MLKKQLKRDFIQKYFAKLSTTNSYAEAYEMAEKDHIRDFGGRRFKNHNCFKVTLHNYLEPNRK